MDTRCVHKDKAYNGLISVCSKVISEGYQKENFPFTKIKMLSQKMYNVQSKVLVQVHLWEMGSLGNLVSLTEREKLNLYLNFLFTNPNRIKNSAIVTKKRQRAHIFTGFNLCGGY
jgi:hypothetical protein